MKIVLIGDSSVGKSALVTRFVQNQLPPTSKATVGIAFFKQIVVDPETNEEYTLQIWDTAGQEKFQSVTTHHYRAADGCLLVYDTTNEASFRNLDRWLNELYENTEPSVVVTLVGTKVDLAMTRRVVSEERGKAYARQNGLHYAETSALWDKRWVGNGRGTATGVEQVFLSLVQAIVRQHRDMGHNPGRIDMSGFSPSANNSVHLGGDGGSRGGCEC
mmetsp:Transcript_110696/g.174474  ORF Transcript_110696/g.174474 Transcript_110696/m.174474 type:complete len:217 (-) Transcript_110696:72-722(-)